MALWLYVCTILSNLIASQTFQYTKYIGGPEDSSTVLDKRSGTWCQKQTRLTASLPHCRVASMTTLAPTACSQAVRAHDHYNTPSEGKEHAQRDSVVDMVE